MNGRRRSSPRFRPYPTLTDVSSDQQNKGLQAGVIIDRDTASRLGITVSQIDNTLYDAFGQRQVSTIYVARNQYHVIMEVAPEYWQNPQTLKDVYVSTLGGPASGSQTTNAVAGTVVSPTQAASVNSRRGQRGPQSCDQLDRRHRQGRIVDRHRGLDQPGDDDSALERRPVRTGPDLACRQPSGASGRQHDLVQSRARRLAERGGDDDRGDHEPDRRSGDDPRLVPGRRQDFPGVARQRAVSRARGPSRRSTSRSACSTRASSIR